MVTNGQAWRRSGLMGGGTAIATATLVISWFQINPPRPDPFTGAQANALRVELERKFEGKLDRHEDQMIARIQTIEETLRRIGSGQTNLYRIVGDLPPDEFEDRVDKIELWIVKKDPNFEPAD